MRKLNISVVAIGLCAATVISAKQSIPTIVVSNARVAQDIIEVLSSVTVISNDEIEKSNAQNVTDLLRTKAGIDVAVNGGQGQTTSVFVRGVANKHTLVLIDGIKASSAVDGTFYWHNLPLSAIERIEIVRGARSSVYGSDAIGGVIQIITKKAAGLKVNVAGGSFNTKRGAFSVGLGNERLSFSLNAGKENSKSFSATNRKVGDNTYNPDADGYDNESLNLKLWTKFSDNFELNASFLQSRSETEYDAFHFPAADFEDFYDTKNKVLSLQLKHQLSDKWQQVFTFGKSKTNSVFSERETKVESYNSNSVRKEYNWQHNIKLKKHLLIFGMDYTEDKAEVKSLFADYSTHRLANRGAYLNLSGSFKGFKYALGLRKDKHDNFGKHTTYQIELGKKIDDNWQLHLAHGTGFKAPTVTELFYPVDFLGRPVGNPDLKPEKSRSFEFGLNYLAGNTKAQMVFFNTKVYDLIEFGYPYQNVSRAQIRGIEVNYSKYINDWTFDAALTMQNTKDATGQDLILRPKQKLALSLARHFAKGELRLESLMVSARDDIDYTSFSRVSLGGYTLFNLSGNFNLNPNLTLGFRINNLLDKNYETIYGYNTPERSFYLELEYKKR